MGPEDKLTHDERVRLESVALALQTVGYPTDGPRTAHVLTEADKIEDFITDGTVPEIPGGASLHGLPNPEERR